MAGAASPRVSDWSAHGGHPTRNAKVPLTRPLFRPARPLIITADPRLLDDLLRCAAAAGVEPEVHADPGPARVSWTAAPIVLLGRDRGLSRRGGGACSGDDVVLSGSTSTKPPSGRWRSRPGVSRSSSCPPPRVGWSTGSRTPPKRSTARLCRSACWAGAAEPAPRRWRWPSPSPAPVAAPR